MLGEGLLPGSQMAVFLCVPPLAEGAGELSGVSCIRAPIPFLRALLPLPKRVQSRPPPIALTLGVRFPHMNLGGHRHGLGHRALLYGDPGLAEGSRN